MTLRLINEGQYDRLMGLLPSPTRALTLSQVNEDYPRHLTELQAGGTIIVYSDDGQAMLGVLTRDPAVLGDAQLAQQIEDGHIPPLDELLAMADRGELS